MAAFAGLDVSSLFLALTGKCSCGCFGGLPVNPWFDLVFDMATVAAHLVSRPPADLGAVSFAHPLRSLGLGLIPLLVGIAGWRQAGLVTAAATATLEGRPLEQATLTFTGESGMIVLRTDYDGNFRLPLVRPGLYSVSAPASGGTAPIQKTEPVDRWPAKKKMQRSVQQSGPAYQRVKL